jgi:hypothetical protein
MVEYGSDGHSGEHSLALVVATCNELGYQITEQAIPIFEEMFAECQALFIFDQSSAHASHGDGALNAFAMNLNDGGRQPICKDTIFPRETLAVSTRIVLGGGAAQARTRAGEVQKMSFVDSEGITVAKGLRTVLTVSRGARHTLLLLMFMIIGARLHAHRQDQG